MPLDAPGRPPGGLAGPILLRPSVGPFTRGGNPTQTSTDRAAPRSVAPADDRRDGRPDTGSPRSRRSGRGRTPSSGRARRFLLTCALHRAGRASARSSAGGGTGPIWLGAALFGAGCLIPVFARPCRSAVYLTGPVTQRLPPVASSHRPRSIIPANARILEALEQPIPMRFPDEIPLGDLLKYIGKATSTPTDPGIPIYVDPIGLQEAERSLNSTVQIDLEGVPLKTTLRLGLTQLGLDYDPRGRLSCGSSARTEPPRRASRIPS